MMQEIDEAGGIMETVRQLRAHRSPPSAAQYRSRGRTAVSAVREDMRLACLLDSLHPKRPPLTR